VKNAILLDTEPVSVPAAGGKRAGSAGNARISSALLAVLVGTVT
jgi:hypothetical protein